MLSKSYALPKQLVLGPSRVSLYKIMMFLSRFIYEISINFLFAGVIFSLARELGTLVTLTDLGE